MQAMQNLGGRRSKSSNNSSASTTGQGSGSGGHHVTTGSSGDSDRRSREIRDFQTSIPENKCCFDCGQRGPTYVDLTAGSFVCTKCSGTLRGINPPHRIKSLSMSSFSAEEVAFIRSRGNVWAAKVFLGLYDHRNAPSDTSSEERVKEFIIEKYEKKRYYVDPSTITYSPPSPPSEQSGSVLSSSSDQHLNGRTTNLIGATLNATLSAGAANAAKSGGISISRPPVAAHNAASNGATTSRSSTSSSNSQQLLAELSAPAPPVAPTDPFGAGSTFGRSATFDSAGSNPGAISTFGASSTFGAASSFSPSGSGDPRSSAGARTAQQAADSFANFDAAGFDASPFEPLPLHPRQSRPDVGLLAVQKPSAVPSGSSSVSSAAPQKPMMSQADRYAALKDLDDIFRTTVSVHDAPPSQHSTGANIFGSPQAPQPSHAAAPNQSASGAFSSSVPKDYPQWTAPHAPSAVSPLAGAEWAWQDKNNAVGARSSNGVKSPPVNPFTGAANLSQLNTSPWPTTGNSPINTGGHQYNASNFAGWPPQGTTSVELASNQNKDPFASITMQSENNNDLFAKAPKPFATMDSNAPSDNNNGFSSDFFPASKPDNNASNPFQAFFETISAPVPQVQQVGNGNPWQSTASGLAPVNQKNPFL